jgi:hypothetical protein
VAEIDKILNEIDRNVYQNYDWTSIPRGSALRANAPRVRVTPFKINASTSLSRIINYSQALVATDVNVFYDNLYKNVVKEDRFLFPYLGDSVRQFSNEYGDTFQSAFLGSVDQVLMGASQFGGAAREVISEAIASMKGEAESNPGSYIETPKLYQYSQNDSGLDVSFALSNTLNSDNAKNAKIVKALTIMNRPLRKNSIIMEPPRIYEVKLPGIRFIKWAYCSSFSVQLLGAKQMYEGEIIPEGYLINMTFTSLTTEVSNFMEKVGGE